MDYIKIDLKEIGHVNEKAGSAEDSEAGDPVNAATNL